MDFHAYLMVHPKYLGSTDYRSIWTQTQPFPRSAGCTCLLSFVSPSITPILSSDLRLILSASISIIPVRQTWARSKFVYQCIEPVPNVHPGRHDQFFYISWL